MMMFVKRFFLNVIVISSSSSSSCSHTTAAAAFAVVPVPIFHHTEKHTDHSEDIMTTVINTMTVVLEKTTTKSP